MLVLVRHLRTVLVLLARHLQTVLVLGWVLQQTPKQTADPHVLKKLGEM